MLNDRELDFLSWQNEGRPIIPYWVVEFGVDHNEMGQGKIEVTHKILEGPFSVDDVR